MGNPDKVAAAEQWLGQTLYDDPQQEGPVNYERALIAAETTTSERGWLGHIASLADAANLIRNPDYGKRLSIVKNADAALRDLEANGHLTLYERQLSAYKAGLEFILNRNPSDKNLAKAGRFEIATGYGKTVLMANLGAALLGKNPLKSQLKLLVVVPSHFLSDQTKGMHPEEEYREGFALHAPHLRTTELSGREFDDSGDVVLTTYSFFCRHAGLADGKLNMEDYPLVFFDEAHHILGNSTRGAIQRSCQSTAAIGFTATPESKSGEHIQSLLPKLLERKTIVDGVLREGFLGGIQMFGVFSHNSIHEIARSKAQEYTLREIEHLIDDTNRNQLIIETALLALEKSEGERGIIRCIPGDQQKHARLLAEALDGLPHPTQDRPIKAKAIGHHQPDSTDIMRRFKAGEFDILTGINMFGEGLDIPELTWAVYAAPSKSLPNLEQFIGRLMRPKEWPALFFQVIDDVRGRDDRVFGFDVFDETPKQGLALLPPNNAQKLRRRLIDPSSLPSHMDPTDDEVWQRLELSARRDMSNTVKDMAQTHRNSADLGKEYISLLELASQFDMPSRLMARILLANSYGSTEALDSRNVLQHYYNKQALTYLGYLISDVDDRTIEQTATELEVEKQKLLYHLHKAEIVPAQAYSHDEDDRAQLMRFLRPAQFATIREVLFSEEYRLSDEGLAPHEITLSEAAQIGNSSLFGKAEYFKIRGFAIARKIISPGERARVVLDREAVLAHIDNYQNAPPLPESGYTLISRHNSKTVQIHILATEHNIPIVFFRNKSVVREYTTDENFARLQALLMCDRTEKGQADTITTEAPTEESSNQVQDLEVETSDEVLPDNLLLGAVRSIAQLPERGVPLSDSLTQNVSIRRFTSRTPVSTAPEQAAPLVSLQQATTDKQPTPQVTQIKKPELPSATTARPTPTSMPQHRPSQTQAPRATATSSNAPDIVLPKDAGANQPIHHAFVSLADVGDTIRELPEGHTLEQILDTLDIIPYFFNQTLGIAPSQAQEARAYIHELLDEQERQKAATTRLERARAGEQIRIEHFSRQQTPVVVPAKAPSRKQLPRATAPRITSEQQIALYTDRFLRGLLPHIPIRPAVDVDFSFTNLRDFATRHKHSLVTIIKLVFASVPTTQTGLFARDEANGLLINQKIRMAISSGLSSAKPIPANWISAHEIKAIRLTTRHQQELELRYPYEVKTITISKPPANTNLDNPSAVITSTPRPGTYFFFSPRLARSIVDGRA